MAEPTKTAKTGSEEPKVDFAQRYQGYGGPGNEGADMDGIRADDEGLGETHDARARLVRERVAQGPTRRQRSEDTPLMDKIRKDWGSNRGFW